MICEECWSDAYLRMLDRPDKSQYDHYLGLLNERHGSTHEKDV